MIDLHLEGCWNSFSGTLFGDLLQDRPWVSFFKEDEMADESYESEEQVQRFLILPKDVEFRIETTMDVRDGPMPRANCPDIVVSTCRQLVVCKGIIM